MTQHRPQLVADGYDQVAQEYAGLETEEDGEWPRQRWLAEVLHRLPADSRVLDLGCGNGVPVTAALAEQHRVTGVDVSEIQIAQARARVPGADLRVGDALELRFPPGSFEAVVAFYTLDHLPRERLGELLTRIRDWLTPGGLLLFSVEPVDQPGTVGQWLGVPMYFSSYPPETTLRLVSEAGFTVLRHETQPQLEGGRRVDWLWVLATADRGPGGSGIQ